ncbi:MAG: hypothetical protein M5U28_00790 [Sandaracinaceae bacterium]|nr:hypothetical protein [Sandaracinaceae bacterium]
MLKEALHAEPEHRDALLPLLRFESSHGEGLTSLAEVKSRMKEGQKAIYYVLGESRRQVESSPHIEAVRARGYEVLYLVDPVDPFSIPALREYEGVPLASAGDAKLSLEGEAAKPDEERESALSALRARFRIKLQDEVSEVRLSTRLVGSPVCLVVPDGGLQPHLERILRAAQRDLPAQKRILEINPSHPIIESLRRALEARRGRRGEGRRVDRGALRPGQDRRGQPDRRSGALQPARDRAALRGRRAAGRQLTPACSGARGGGQEVVEAERLLEQRTPARSGARGVEVAGHDHDGEAAPRELAHELRARGVSPVDPEPVVAHDQIVAITGPRRSSTSAVVPTASRSTPSRELATRVSARRRSGSSSSTRIRCPTAADDTIIRASPRERGATVLGGQGRWRALQSARAARRRPRGDRDDEARARGARAPTRDRAHRLRRPRQHRARPCRGRHPHDAVRGRALGRARRLPPRARHDLQVRARRARRRRRQGRDHGLPRARSRGRVRGARARDRVARGGPAAPRATSARRTRTSPRSRAARATRTRTRRASPAPWRAGCCAARRPART